MIIPISKEHTKSRKIKDLPIHFVLQILINLGSLYVILYQFHLTQLFLNFVLNFFNVVCN